MQDGPELGKLANRSRHSSLEEKKISLNGVEECHCVSRTIDRFNTLKLEISVFIIHLTVVFASHVSM